MTFLAPGWLAVAAIASAAVLALHLLNRQWLRRRPFPTARFVPDVSVRSVSRTWQPTDLLLLLLRVGTLVLIGFALARPVGAPPRRMVVIALVDSSPAADSATLAAALARRATPPDTVIAFDNLSAGLVAARHAAARLSGRGDKVALSVISPLTNGLWDAATGAIRATWPGAIGLVRIRQRPNARSGKLPRIVWPAGGTLRDTANAVYSAGVAMVGSFPRVGSGRAGNGKGKVIAWFADGSPAVVEYPTPTGCERNVGLEPDRGDALIRGAGLRFAERLAAPCGAGWTPEQYELAGSALVNALAGSGPVARSQAFEQDADVPIRLFPLVLALLALGAERLVRRRVA